MSKLERQSDAAANRFFAEQARKAGVTVGRWMESAGILSARVEKSIERHEIPASHVDPVLMEVIVANRSVEAYRDVVPGGSPVASVLDNGKVEFVKDMPKRRRGRPVKNFVRGDDDAGES